MKHAIAAIGVSLWSFGAQLSLAHAQAHAEPREIIARGAKECRVYQYRSALNEGRHSLLAFRVLPNRSVRLYAISRTYPGTRMFLLSGGQRISGPGQIDVPAAVLQRLRANQEFHASWVNWPYRVEVNYRERFDGFDAAYRQCVEFLTGQALRSSSPPAPSLSIHGLR
jgi:hypothetical protein